MTDQPELPIEMPPLPEDDEPDDEPVHSPEQTTDFSLKHLALACFLELDPDDLDVTKYDDNQFDLGTRTSYRVLTDDEANDEASEELKRYAEEFVLSRIPESLRSYFDTERWIEDALSQSDRGTQLSNYDGNEEEFRTGTEAFREWVYVTFGIAQTVEPETIEFETGVLSDGETFYIYRTN